MGAAAIETIEGISIEASRKPAMEPLKRGRSGMITRMGGILSGPIPLALRIASAFAGPRRSRQLRKIAAASSVAGSMLTRIAWVHAGHVSAENWRLPLEIKEPVAEEQSSSHGLNISDRDTGSCGRHGSESISSRLSMHPSAPQQSCHHERSQGSAVRTQW
jgi:hypothetical protein